MSLFDRRRLPVKALRLDVDGLRSGYYSDKYFENVVHVLAGAQQEGYRFHGASPRALPFDPRDIDVARIEVEAQLFNRRAPFTLAAGVDAALAMIRSASGYFDGGQFVECWRRVEVEAVEDGTLIHYGGDPLRVLPVLRIRGRYRDIALLETPMLGVLTRATRVATNVYEVLHAARGKRILFFPARFDLPEAQSMDGYAYWLAVQRYNHDTRQHVAPLVSTDAQAAWWGGGGGGTVPHALIACFLADTAEAMIAYARHIPVEVRRIALVDFNNDTVGASLAVLDAFWPFYRAALETGDEEERRRWTLHGVRIDTSANVRDISLGPDDPYGVNPKLIRVVREALDNAWTRWHVPQSLQEAAQRFCAGVEIVVSGGFDRRRIEDYERDGVPVDIYGVGSRFFQNDAATNTDYTMDIVRVRINDQWVDMAKTGRQSCDNPDLKPIDWEAYEME